MNSEEREYLSNKDIRTTPQFGLGRDTFPTDVVWIGFEGKPTECLLPVLFGCEDQYKNTRQVVKEAINFLRDCEADRRPSLPAFYDSPDKPRIELTASYIVYRLSPSSVDTPIQGTGPSDTNTVARHYNNKYRNGEYIEYKVDQTAELYVDIDLNPRFGSHTVECTVPVFSGEPCENQLNRRYRNVEIPIAILSEDGEMPRDDPVLNDVPCTMWPFTI